MQYTILIIVAATRLTDDHRVPDPADVRVGHDRQRNSIDGRAHQIVGEFQHFRITGRGLLHTLDKRANHKGVFGCHVSPGKVLLTVVAINHCS